MNTRGTIRGCVMQIMFWGNKAERCLILLLLAFVATGQVFAGSATPWLGNKNGLIHMDMANGSAYALKLSPDMEGVFYDRSTHELDSGFYISVFEVLPSNPDQPVGFCGAGSEVWLSVYKVAGTALDAKTRALVSSCLHSISMASQNSGAPDQESDFSSVRWNAKGFSIEWFDNVDARGRPLSSTDYVLQNGTFSRHEVVSQQSQNP